MSKAARVVRALSGMVLALVLVPMANAQHYVRTDLTRDSANASATAANTDPNLVNAWGLARGSGGPWWISDNGAGLSTLYDAAGAPQTLVVTIPPPPGQPAPSAPTGTVLNFTKGFELAPGHPAAFLFVTEDGTISGWSPAVNPTTAVIKVNRNGRAVYKGCAIAMTANGPLLYATNFQTRRVDVFDSNFNPVRTDDDAFHFEGAQNVAGLQLSPFNIQNIGGSLVVTYALKQPGSKDEEHGAGFGQVAVFDTAGRRAMNLQHGAWINAPWGVALAPSDFGPFSHRLLIGNFGDGTIQVFNVMTGLHEGELLDASGSPLTIGGLWALGFGGGSTRNGLSTDLYFTAGPNDESDGLFGKISPTSTEQHGNAE